jgi:hypothetical protein
MPCNEGSYATKDRTPHDPEKPSYYRNEKIVKVGIGVVIDN